MGLTLIDAGPIIAYFDSEDEWHAKAQRLIGKFRGQFVTTCPVVTEAMWQLGADHRVQNELLMRVARGLFRSIPLDEGDFARILELNDQYQSLPADFADLSLVAVAERLDISEIVSIDSEFDIYRRKLGHKLVPFKRISL